MRENYARILCPALLAAALCTPSAGRCASWEVGLSYAFNVADRDPGEWTYFGKAISAGIVTAPMKSIQLGVYTSYGRYRYEREPVYCFHNGYACDSYRGARSLSAVDLGIMFRAIPPPETQRVREFLFISYAGRITDFDDWSDAFYDTAELSIGFGGLVRLASGTRLLFQGGPAFGRKLSVVSLPLSVMVQFGSP